MAEVTQAERVQARLHLDQSVIALTTAATLILASRPGVQKEYEGMITALRDDISRMIGDIAAFKASIL